MPFEDQYIGEAIPDPNVREGERTYAMFIHLTLVIASILFPVIPALILWKIKQDESTFIDDHGREAVNFQISLLLYMIAGTLLSLVCIGIPLIIGVYVLGLVGMILGASRAYQGCYFRYPRCIRLLKVPTR